jgi:hypothetical protein
MIELAFTACLAANPDVCKPVTLTYAGEGLTPMQCMVGSQAQLAEWSAANPKWRVKRWGCRPARMYSKA